MALQAYIDDSYTADGTFVLGGFIASSGAWTDFSAKWDAMLSAGTLAKIGKYHFKMNEMAVNEERMERVPAFYWIIEDHVLLALSCKINTTELRRARARIYVPNLKIDFGPFENPYFVAYRCLLDMFHNHRQKIEKLIVPDQTVDFNAIRASWEGYINSCPDSIKSLYGASPRFEDDQISLPLQAADFWAWWVRKWYEEGSPDKMKTCDFGKWRREKPPPGMAISFDEDHLLNELRNIIRSGIEPGRPIYDVQFLWRSS